MLDALAELGLRDMVVAASSLTDCHGHLYLIETAAGACDTLHLFILSEDRSEFSPKTRMELVRQGTAHIRNVIVHPTSDYLISSATFPSYFLKEKARASEISCALDLTIFAECFARPMNIKTRFVGSEPCCPVTSAYNLQMHRVLPQYGIAVEELPRCERAGRAVSASLVRELLAQGALEDIRPLVPATTFRFLEGMWTQ